jgi:hypothetical protein
MGLTPEERTTLETWLSELTWEMQDLNRRISVLATVIRDGKENPRWEGRPPPAD